MPKPYSIDLRGRVIGEVETGASRREAAERYGLSPSVVVIWVQRFEECGFRRMRPGNPIERGHAFRSNAATFSDEGGRARLPA